MNQKLITFSFISLLVFLTGCDNPTPQHSSKPLYHKTKVENIAWMREKLPADTFAYLRIPTLWQLFFEAKNDVLQPVQSSDNHVQQIAAFKQGLLDSFAKFVPLGAQSPLALVAKNMVSPLEIAIINATDGSMVPNMLIATTLEDTSITQLNGILGTLIKQAGSQVSLSKPIDANGKGKLIVSMAPVYISYDENSGKLAFYSGLTTSEKQLESLLAQNHHAKELDHIFTFEDSQDQAGKNLEIWLNIQAIYQQNKGFIPPSQQPKIKQMGLDKARYLWLGTSAKNGKSEFVFRLAMPDVGFRKFLPRVASNFDVDVAGTPRSVWQIVIPNVEQFIQGYELVLKFIPDAEKERKKIEEHIVKIEKFLGFSLADAINAYSQKLLIITDDSGTWFASKIVNPAIHAKIGEKIEEAFKTKTQLRELAGVEIKHTIFSTEQFEQQLFPQEEKADLMEQIFGYTQHVFYQEQGDYFIQAYSPQVLADRANSDNMQKLSTWLNNTHGLDNKQSIFAYNKEVKDAPRDIYHTYLSTLLILGHLTKVEVDLFKLPTAQQMGLPNSGRFGIALDSASDNLTLKVSYEYSLMETVTSSSNSFLAIGFVGVLAAYAIPAYRDYTLRAKVAEKKYSAHSEQVLIEEHFYQKGVFPNTEFISERFNQSKQYLYNPKNGQITIYFTDKDDSGLSGHQLVLTPTEVEGYIEWQCTSSVSQSQLPANCTNN